jgi:hypothetical protein
MREADRVQFQSIRRRKWMSVKWPEETDEITFPAAENGQIINPLLVTEYENSLPDDLPDPIGIEMIAIKMRQTDGDDLAGVRTHHFHALVGGSRSDAAVDQDRAAVAAQHRAISC